MNKLFITGVLIISSLQLASAHKAKTILNVYELPRTLHTQLIENLAAEQIPNELKKLVTAGEATLFDSVFTSSESGITSKVSSGYELDFQTYSESGELVWTKKFVGTQLEVVPAIGGNDFVVELNVNYSKSLQFGVVPQAHLDRPQLQIPHIKTLSYVSALTLYDGYKLHVASNPSLTNEENILAIVVQVCLMDATGAAIRECVQ